MFRWIAFLGIGIGWLLLAAGLALHLPPWFPPPDIPLIFAVSASWQAPLPLGVFLSWCLGLMQDFLSGGVIGLNPLAKTAVLLFSSWIRQRVYLPPQVSKVALVLLGTLTDGALVTAILGGGGALNTPFLLLLRQFFLGAIATLLISPLVFTTIPRLGGVVRSGYDERAARRLVI